MASFYLKPNRGCRCPAVVAAIGISTREIASDEPTHAYGERLEMASGLAVRLERGRATRDRGASWESPGICWKWARDLCAGGRTVWVFCAGGLRTATLTGLWGAIDDGTFTLWDRKRADGIPRRLLGDQHERRKGYLLAQSDRFVADLRSGKGRIKVIGLENYFGADGASVESLLARLPQSGQYGGSAAPGQPECVRRKAAVILDAALALLRWWRESGQGNFAATASGLAWNSFRHSHYRHRVLIHDNADIRDLEARAYSGGRIRCLWRGYWPGGVQGVCAVLPVERGGSVHCIDGPVYHIDIRGAYPRVMRCGMYPVHLRGSGDSGTPEQLIAASRCYVVCAAVRLSNPQGSYPSRSEGRTTYPRQTAWCVLAGPELTDALARGKVDAVHHWCYYSAAPLFRDYVDYWWDRRLRAIQSGDPSMNAMCKMMLDSLYGRFAMRARRWIDRPDLPAMVDWGPFAARDFRTREFLRCRAIAGHTQVLEDGGWSASAAIAIPAWVTSYGRLQMRALVESLPPRSVLYYHTDGALVTRAAHEAILARGGYQPETLGGIRLVGVYDRGAIHGIGHYQLGDQIVRAGAPAGWRPTEDGGAYYDRGQSGAEVLARRPSGSYWTVRGRFGFGGTRDPGPIDREGYVD